MRTDECAIVQGLLIDAEGVVDVSGRPVRTANAAAISSYWHYTVPAIAGPLADRAYYSRRRLVDFVIGSGDMPGGCHSRIHTCPSLIRYLIGSLQPRNLLQFGATISPQRYDGENRRYCVIAARLSE
jgi:hypothetical protein